MPKPNTPSKEDIWDITKSSHPSYVVFHQGHVFNVLNLFFVGVFGVGNTDFVLTKEIALLPKPEIPFKWVF